MRFRDGDKSVIAICPVDICRVDDPAAGTASSSRNDVMQRSLVVRIEEVSDIERNVRNREDLFQVALSVTQQGS